jgi:ABC-type antimicrobial peptide transport system permease subunit
VRGIVHDLDPDQAVPDLDTAQSIYDLILKAVRLGTHTIGAMGVLGLALALVGLYGLIAYDVNARTREIGIRMALGAGRGSVLSMVLRPGIALAVCGTAAGLGINAGVVRLLGAFFGSGNQPANATPAPNGGTEFSLNAGSGDIPYLALGVAVLTVTILAAYFPARRATRVDPNVALRCE